MLDHAWNGFFIIQKLIFAKFSSVYFHEH
jgi:hypothetical protein